jgi:hypothetical protein
LFLLIILQKLSLEERSYCHDVRSSTQFRI